MGAAMTNRPSPSFRGYTVRERLCPADSVAVSGGVEEVQTSLGSTPGNQIAPGSGAISLTAKSGTFADTDAPWSIVVTGLDTRHGSGRRAAAATKAVEKRTASFR
jgi:hypothetical protein